jgi:quinol monooxygenase YgiN
LSDIAVVTQASEPKTLAYAWFESTGDNSAIPNHWVRGFEVYDNESAIAEVHRSSEPYKKMRLTVGRDHILERPTDLRFLQPTGVGFMVRSEKTVTFLKSDSHVAEEKGLIVILEIKPEEDMKLELLKDLENLGEYVKGHEHRTASFWVLEYLPEYSDDSIVIFSRFDSNTAYEQHLASRRTAEAR